MPGTGAVSRPDAARTPVVLSGGEFPAWIVTIRMIDFSGAIAPGRLIVSKALSFPTAFQEETMKETPLGPGAVEWLGTLYRTTLPTEATGGTMSITDSVSPPGFGPPRHIHHDADETFVMLTGDAEFWAGRRPLHLRAWPGGVHSPRYGAYLSHRQRGSIAAPGDPDPRAASRGSSPKWQPDGTAYPRTWRTSTVAPRATG